MSAGSRWLRAALAIAITLILVGALLMVQSPRLYPWLKALHVIAVIAWMAGMLYLPRLFVYHCEARAGLGAVRDLQGDGAATAAAPSSIRRWSSTWVLGLWLAWTGGCLSSGWLHAQARAGADASGLHGFFVPLRARLRRRPQPITRRGSTESSTRCRRVLMIGIVILVVVKPF